MATNQPPRTGSRLNYDASSRAIERREPDAPIEAIKRHKAFLDARLAKISEWVTNGLRPEALIRFAMRDMDGPRGEALRKCSPESIYLGLLACAVTGLEPGALKGEAYLVPFKGEATFMVGYRGIIKMARRSRGVAAIWSNVVYEGDEFEVDLGSANRIVHRPRLGSRGEKIIAAYAIARMANGQDEIELMDDADLDAVKKAGQGGPAWKDWGDQMMRKSPIRRLGKRLPLNADYYVALALDAATPDEQRRIIDVETSGESNRAELHSQIADEMTKQATGDISPEEAAEIAKQESARKDQ